MSARGAIAVMSVFAAIWWMVGAAQSGRGSPVVYAIGLAISVLMVAVAWRGRGGPVTPEERKRRGRIVGIASAVEGAAILVAVIILTRLGRRDLIAPAIAIVVGAHFLPIARWFPAPIYYLTGALLVAIGLAGAFVADPSARILMVCIGAADVLWLSCGIVLIRARRRSDSSGVEKTAV